jgi:hypothetical protein
MTSFRLVLFATIAITATVCEARIHRSWSYQDLMKEADVVVIADAVLSKDTEQTDDLGKDYLLQMETTLNVHAVLKGKIDKGTLKFVHFRYDPDWNSFIFNGPQLVGFQTEPVVDADTADEEGKKQHLRISRHHYLLFLKRRSDGRYEAVSGQMDPVYSVKLLTRPDDNPLEGRIPTIVPASLTGRELPK